MYFLSAAIIDASGVQEVEVLGFFETLKDAMEEIQDDSDKHNATKLHQSVYTHLVVEDILPGLQQKPVGSWWYVRKNGTWVGTPPIEEFNITFAIG